MMSLHHKLTVALFAIIILIGWAGFSAQPAAAVGDIPCAKYHTVQRAETLATIAQKYGVTENKLMQMNDLDDRVLFRGQVLCVQEPGPKMIDDTTPIVYALVVRENESVTIQALNFPEHATFDVQLSRFGRKSYTTVGRLRTGIGGSLTATYDIPRNLWDARRLAIHLVSTDERYIVDNWFYNESNSENTGGDYAGIPSFSIYRVVAGETVTIRTKNFPARIEFDVYMDVPGDLAEDGIYIATFGSYQGGSFRVTFDIPRRLRGRPQIAIRLVNNSGLLVYNEFENISTP